MANGMRTQTELMRQGALNANDVADQLTSELNTLMTNIAPLKDYYKGAGGSSFQDVQARFNEDMARLNVALRTIAEAVGSSGRDYVVTDEEMQQEMTAAGAPAGQISDALIIN